MKSCLTKWVKSAHRARLQDGQQRGISFQMPLLQRADLGLTRRTCGSTLVHSVRRCSAVLGKQLQKHKEKHVATCGSLGRVQVNNVGCLHSLTWSPVQSETRTWWNVNMRSFICWWYLTEESQIISSHPAPQSTQKDSPADELWMDTHWLLHQRGLGLMYNPHLLARTCSGRDLDCRWTTCSRKPNRGVFYSLRSREISVWRSQTQSWFLCSG